MESGSIDNNKLGKVVPSVFPIIPMKFMLNGSATSKREENSNNGKKLDFDSMLQTEIAKLK